MLYRRPRVCAELATNVVWTQEVCHCVRVNALRSWRAVKTWRTAGLFAGRARRDIRGFVTLAVVVSVGCGAKVDHQSAGRAESDPLGSGGRTECKALLAGSEAVDCRTELCDEALSQPARRVRWSVAVDGRLTAADAGSFDVPNGEQMMLVECLMAKLEELGIDAETNDGTRVSWTSAYSEVQSILGSTTLGDVLVSPAPRSTVTCEGLSEHECQEQDCSPIFGIRLDELRHCEETAYAGCIEVTACHRILVPAVDADGACWSLPPCLPEGFSTKSSASGECPEKFRDTTMCEAR